MSTHLKSLQLYLGLFAFIFCGTACAQSIILEAEDGALEGTTVMNEPEGFSGAGFVTGFSNNRDAVTMTFELDSAGVYEFSIGYRTPEGLKGFAGSLNGLGFSGMFPQTTEFSELVVGKVILKEGINTVTISGGWNYYQIDYVRFSSSQPYASPRPIHPLPVTPNATDETKWVYAYLLSNYGKHTLSGQHTLAEISLVHDLSGKAPAILSEDFMDYSPSRIEHGANPGQLTERVIQKAKEGHIVSFCWHWNAPSGLMNTKDRKWWSGFYTDATTFDIEATLADKDGRDYQLILRDIDTIAGELQKLKEAGIPVLWRPLHESEGGWFWWGAKGSGPFKELWRILFERLTIHHGLNNLIWVLTSEDEDWYPGDDVVDIIGVDAYPGDVRDTLALNWQRLFERFDGKKMIAITEFGGIPDIPSMHKLGIRWAYFASWQGDLGARHNPTDEVVRIYQDPTTINLEDLQARHNMTSWGPYPVSNGQVDTGSWLGVLDVTHAPILYSHSLQRSIFLFSNSPQTNGDWMYVYP